MTNLETLETTLSTAAQFLSRRTHTGRLDALGYLDDVPALVKAAQTSLVYELRRSGVGWARIAGALGITRQAARQRFPDAP